METSKIKATMLSAVNTDLYAHLYPIKMRSAIGNTKVEDGSVFMCMVDVMAYAIEIELLKEKK